MAPRTDRTTRIPSGFASPVTTNHAAEESVFVDFRNTGNLNTWPGRGVVDRLHDPAAPGDAEDDEHGLCSL